jgi:ABC-type sugar transport system ATPase subunit
LSAQETARLFEVVRVLRSSGVGILYISHRIGELRDIADRVTVLRDGRVAASHPMQETTREALVREMIGRELREMYPPRRTEFGEPALVVTTVAAGETSGDSSPQEIVAVFACRSGHRTPYVAAGYSCEWRVRDGVGGFGPADRHLRRSSDPRCGAI